MTALTEVFGADLGSNPYGSDVRTTGTAYGYVATFNTPTSSTFDTIVMPKVYGGNVGDVIKVNVFKGSIPDDALDDNDDDETEAYLDVNDFVEESTYTVTETIPSTGIEIKFPFSTTFSQALLGDTYTVTVEQFDSSGLYVPFSPVFCTDRDGVYNFINDDDAGYEGGSGSGNFHIQGGAGNLYVMDGGTLNTLASFGFTRYSLTVGTGTWTVDGTSTKDPCPAWGIYSRSTVSSNATASSPYGTTRSLTGSLTNSLTAGLTQ